VGKLAGEYRFERRLRKLFEKEGFVVIKCARSRPFDLIVMKMGVVVAIEVKSERKNLTEPQLEMQIDLATQAGVNYVALRQMKGGKIKLSSFKGTIDDDALVKIERALGKKLVK